MNWRNPEVVSAMHDVMRFWLKLGVSGFRVDAFINLLEDPQLRNEPIDPTWRGPPIMAGYEKLIHTRTENQKGMHAILQSMQGVLQEFGKDRMMIGEVYADKVVSEKDVMRWAGRLVPSRVILIPSFGNFFSKEFLVFQEADTKKAFLVGIRFFLSE